MALVTVVVVNYNTGEDAAACVASAAADLAGTDWRAIVVDNASREGSLAALDAAGPRVAVIRNTTNRGFGAAVNQAARLRDSLSHDSGDGPWLLLLNPDCRVRPGLWTTLRAVMDEHPDCAIAGPQLVESDGTVQESARGEPTALTGLFGRHGALRKVLPQSRMTRDNLRAAAIVASGVASATVDWLTGAAMLIRRSAFDEVGGFDEKYFLYWEDADLCRRLRDRGDTIRYVPGAVAEHAGARSSRTARAASIRAFHRSAYRYYATHTVRSPWNPARWFAWTMLTARACWRIFAAK